MDYIHLGDLTDLLLNRRRDQLFNLLRGHAWKLGGYTGIADNDFRVFTGWMAQEADRAGKQRH